MPGLSAIEIALLGGNVLGGLFSGLSQSSAQNKQTEEQARQFNIQGAMSPTRALEGLPLRDRLLHIMLQRFGNRPNTYAQAQASYTPGAGGTARSKGVYEEMLRRMGYNPNTGVNTQRPPRQAGHPLAKNF